MNQLLKKINLAFLKFLMTALLIFGAVACHEEDEIDFRAPSITVDSPTPGSDVTALSVLISGTVSSDTVLVELTVDTVTTTATLVGTSYSGNVSLVSGDNAIKAEAQDANGNRSSVTFHLVYPELSLANGAAATLVIGQADFTSNSANRGTTPTANSLSGVMGTLHELANTTLYIPDTGNHRVLGFNAVPAAIDTSANFVLGQGSFTTNASGTSATEFSAPRGIATTATQLFLADSGNNRVLMWNSLPTSNTSAATHVIGQADFISSGSNCNSSSLSSPVSVFVVNDKVVVLDQGNHRVLIWNTIPAADGVAADLVIGQVEPNAMDHCMANDSDGDNVTDSLTASTLNSPGGIWTDGTHLLVADTGNNRVLVWDSFPVSNGEAADWVIGQDDMVSSVTALNDNSLNAPKSVSSNKNQIFIADSGNARVLIFDQFPSGIRPSADGVIGQPDFVTSATGTSETQMTSYDNVFVDRSRLFVVDGHRILMFTSP